MPLYGVFHIKGPKCNTLYYADNNGQRWEGRAIISPCGSQGYLHIFPYQNKKTFLILYELEDP